MSPEKQKPKEERSLGELFTELSRETSTLVRQEVSLAKAEMSQKVSEVGKDVIFLIAGGAVAYLGMFALIIGLILLLALADVPPWASALLVGILVTLLGAFLVQKGLARLKKADLTPHETLETLKEDKEWAKEQTK